MTEVTPPDPLVVESSPKVIDALEVVAPQSPGVVFWTQMKKSPLAIAGGLLLAGPDPTGNGGVIPGFGDQRELELLVEAGFSPVEAIKIGTLNGATYLGLADRIGSIAAGKNADMFIVKGNPAANINDVENVIVVFKDGVGYDSAKLIQSVKGRFGQY